MNDGVEFYRVDHRTDEFFAQQDGIEVYGQLIYENEISTKVAYNISFNEMGFVRVGCPAALIIMLVVFIFSGSAQENNPILLMFGFIMVVDLYEIRRQRRGLAGKIRRSLLDSSKSKNL